MSGDWYAIMYAEITYNLGYSKYNIVMTTEENNRYRDILLQTMKAFIAFCNEHEIIYYACGGTAIGAVRHQGMIPWDDDIDVYMDRENYNRFIKLWSSSQEKYSNYEVIRLGDDGYYLPLTKFADKTTTIWETPEYPFIFGVYVDIFPLDFTSGSYQDIAQRADAYRRTIQSYIQEQEHYNWSLFVNRLKQHGFLKGLLTVLYHIGYCRPFRRAIWRRAEKQLEELLKYEGNQGICYGIEYTREHEVFPKEWFGEPLQLPFEDFTISMPRAYDAYLSKQYGDYMKLPPESERYSVHGRYFIDLDKRWDLRDLRKHLSKR